MLLLTLVYVHSVACVEQLLLVLYTWTVNVQTVAYMHA